MNRLTNPVGPESKGVYLRRRLAVLGVLVAIVVFGLLVWFKPGSSGGAAQAPDVKVPADIQAADKPAASTGEDAACATGDLVVTPVTNQESYAPGEMPLLSLKVESVAEEPCQADLGTATMAFKITSGSDEVWRSTDCQVNPESLKVILEPNKPLETEPLTWDRTRSSPETCDFEREVAWAEGSTYHLHVSIAGVQGQGTAPFLLY